MGNEQRSRRQQFAALACGVVVVVALLGWIVVSILHLRGPSDSGAGRSSREPGAIAGKGAIDLPIMLLADYYEHGIEHAPPRDPSGCMQRRERYYTAPPNPFVLARTKLSQSGADVELRKWMESRQSGFGVGKLAESGELKSLEPLLSASSLQCEVLLEIGRAFNFLEGDGLAACWYRAGLVKAEQQYKDTQPGDLNARPLLSLLDQTKALWRLNDYAAMEKRFALAKRLNPQLSPESRRAGYLYVEMLYYQGRFQEAATAILAVQTEHERAGDLGSLEQSDIGEMHWVQGLFLSYANRHAEAIPHFEAIAARPSSEHAQGAAAGLFGCLARVHRTAEAAKRLGEYVARYHPEQREVAEFVEMLERSKAAATGR
jgi:hypothetical protein